MKKILLYNAESHYISVNAPLLPSTRNMLSAEQFSKMRDGVCLVSTGRGGIINESALKDAILSGKVAAAALDVIADEVTPYSPLFNMKEVTITPHVAYYSEDSCNGVRQKAVQQVIDVLWQQKNPACKIN